jgi:lysophospholipase L1-like esterase
MQIVWDQDRAEVSPGQRPRNLFRVLCMGDSMVYGSGVPRSQALPAQLERILNGAVWHKQFEVINCGICGYSLYDVWHRFLHHSIRYKPDLALLIICDNDPELIGAEELNARGNAISYHDHLQSCWDRNGPHLPYFELALTNVGEQCRQMALPLILGYYDVYNQPLRNNIIEILKRLVAQQRIDFVDLSLDFVGQKSAIHKNTVSPADGHPSPAAHEIAAARLARHILAGGYLSRTNGSFIPERELYRRQIADALEMSNCGYPVEQALYDLRRMMALKRNCRVRLSFPSTELLDDAEYEQTRLSVASMLSRRQLTLFCAAHVRSLEADRGKIEALMFRSANDVRTASKVLFVLDQSVKNPHLPEVSIYHGFTIGSMMPMLREMPDEVIRWADAVKKAQDSLDKLDAVMRGPVHPLLRGFAAPIDSSYFDSVGQLRSYLRGLDEILHSLYGLLQYLSEILQNPAWSGSDSRMQTCGRIANTLFSVRNAAREIIELCRLDRLMDPVVPREPARFTSCSLTISSTAEQPVAIAVQVIPTVPSSSSSWEFRWIIRDGVPHDYQLEFPLFFAGDIRIQLYPTEDASIQGIALYNSPERKTTLKLSEGVSVCPGEHFFRCCLLSL